MSDFFNEAYRRARGRYTAEQWLALAPQQVTQAIYRAMREIDADAAGQMAAGKNGKPARSQDEDAAPA